MMNRRTFSTLFAGSVAAPGLTSSLSWGQAAKPKSALYSGVGTDFTHYEVDPDAATLRILESFIWRPPDDRNVTCL